MIFLFTRNNYPASKIIRWGLEAKEDVSHFALVDTKYPRSSSLILDSTFQEGVRVLGIHEFLKHNEVVYAFAIPKGNNKAHMRAFAQIHTELYGKDYDIKGVSFLAVSIIVCIKLMGQDLPPENKWADKTDFFCSEVLKTTEEFLAKYSDIQFNRYSSQMLTPDRGVQIFKDSMQCVNIAPMFKESKLWGY